MNVTTFVFLAVLVGLAITFARPQCRCLASLMRAVARSTNPLLANDNPLTVGEHEGGRVAGYLDSAPLTTRFMLVKQGSADNNYTIITHVNDIPAAVCTDEPAETTDVVNFQFLNSGGKTQRMVAASAIDAGDLVVSNGDGKIKTLPATAGVYWGVGYAMTTASTDGDLVEVDPIRTQISVGDGS